MTGRAALGGIVVEPTVAPLLGTALFIPGFTGSREDFIHLFEDLSSRGWRVIAVDLPGQQASPGEDDETGYSLSSLGSIIAEFIETFDSPHVIGHSLGGLVVQAAVEAGAQPASVTLLCSGSGALPPDRHGPLPALVGVLPQISMEQLWTLKEAIDRENGWDPPTPEIYEFVRSRFIAHNPHALKAMAETLMTAEVAAELPRSLRLLVAHGEDDDAWPIEHQQEVARRHGTIAVSIPGAGHSPAVDQPRFTAALLHEFWLAKSGFGPDARGHNRGVTTEFPLPTDPSAARVAREHLATLTDSDAAALVVTELVANAIEHGVGPYGLSIEITENSIILRVTDSDPRSLPMEVSAGDFDIAGRGLTLIGAISSDWGWQRDEHGKTVWAMLPLEAA